MSEVKWVVVERQNMSGRYVALPGVSYPTQAEAEAHIIEKFDPRYHEQYHVESRAVKKSDKGKRMHCQACGRAILTKRARLPTTVMEGLKPITRPPRAWAQRGCRSKWIERCSAGRSSR